MLASGPWDMCLVFLIHLGGCSLCPDKTNPAVSPPSIRDIISGFIVHVFLPNVFTWCKQKICTVF